MSDTPRTDAAYARSTRAGVYELFKESQDIEHELNAAKKHIKRMESGDAALNYSIGLDLQKENDALKQRIKRMEDELMDVKNKHAVLVADVVLNEDRAERIKRLEEAGDAMFLRSTRIGREIWLKAKEAKL